MGSFGTSLKRRLRMTLCALRLRFFALLRMTRERVGGWIFVILTFFFLVIPKLAEESCDFCRFFKTLFTSFNNCLWQRFLGYAKALKRLRYDEMTRNEIHNPHLSYGFFVAVRATATAVTVRAGHMRSLISHRPNSALRCLEKSGVRPSPFIMGEGKWYCFVALSVGSFGYAQDDSGVIRLRLWGPSTTLRMTMVL
jgi:hypothetical protein